MKHALGIFGVIAAAALLAVSAAMNWRFGYSLGKSELDAQLLGAASVAADVLKALIPFFVFAAIRNRQWPQAAAAGLLWSVVLTYSLTSALGFSALNRADTQGLRKAEAATYESLKADLDKSREQLSWVPQHRPAATVSAEIAAKKQSKRWTATSQCTNATTGASFSFCRELSLLEAEMAAALGADQLQERIDSLRTSLAAATSAVALAGSDPQATVLANLSGQDQEFIETALTVMVAVLVELGSSLGFFVAFSTWKLHDQREPEVVAMAIPVAAQVTGAVFGANDNRSVAPAKLVAPQTDVERFAHDRIEASEGDTLTATELYEDYCDWCEEHRRERMTMPAWGRQFSELGFAKKKSQGLIQYVGIKLQSEVGDMVEGGVKLPELARRVA